MLDEAAKYLHTAVELKALRSCPKEYYEKLSWLRRNAEPVFVSVTQIFVFNHLYSMLTNSRNKKPHLMFQCLWKILLLL
jgi:hypothetical protein